MADEAEETNTAVGNRGAKDPETQVVEVPTDGETEEKRDKTDGETEEQRDKTEEQRDKTDGETEEKRDKTDGETEEKRDRTEEKRDKTEEEKRDKTEEQRDKTDGETEEKRDKTDGETEEKRDKTDGETEEQRNKTDGETEEQRNKTDGETEEQRDRTEEEQRNKTDGETEEQRDKTDGETEEQRNKTDGETEEKRDKTDGETEEKRDKTDGETEEQRDKTDGETEEQRDKTDRDEDGQRDKSEVEQRDKSEVEQRDKSEVEQRDKSEVEQRDETDRDKEGQRDKTDGDDGGQRDKPVAESSWSILSLARKATETISIGVESYGAALRHVSSSSSVSSASAACSPTRTNVNNEPTTGEKLPALPPKDPVSIERSNLLSMMKLSIKVLIQSSLSLGRTLDSDYPPLQQFFVVLEHCLKHGLKAKKSFIGQNKSIWGPLELVEKFCPESADITTSARDLPGIKTGLGRARAWLHLALMQKKVADYMKALLDRKDLLGEFYDPGALLMEEEGTVIVGMLVGLNVIDANLCIKGEDLDSQVAVIDFSLYLKDPAANSESQRDDAKMTAILDQKHYIEELNRHLSGTVTDLQAKMDSVEKTNRKLIEELTAATDRINSLREEQETLRRDNETILQSSQKKEEATLQDNQVELETYRQTRQGLDEMYNVVWKQFKEEKRIRQELERELELQVGLKQEMEVAMRLLEKDTQEKQDTLAALRVQLDQVKALNLQMFHKAQDSGREAEKKQEEARQLEEKMRQMEAAMKELDQRLQSSEQERRRSDRSDEDMRSELEDKVQALHKQLTDLDLLRLRLEAELSSEKEQRLGLQRALQREQDNSTELRTQLQQLQGLTTELQDLKKEKMQLRQRCEQQETALQEMGLHLSQSKLKMEDFKEVNKALKGHAWLKDDEATQCKQCQKEFSISRRKHHCRNCGDIYCNSCSGNELALPSYPRPVRVCDICHSLLLQRSSSTAS